MSDVQDLQRRAIEIRKQYEALNASSGRNVWQIKEYMMGFIGDVGDLMKLVMAKENLRDADDLDARLAHELADCLWCVLILSDHYKVDLAATFKETMNELERRIKDAKP